MDSIGIRVNKELIGNLMILIADKCAPLHHTKLIKMLYLIDEEAVKDCGVPITWLDYKVWQYGPVDPATFFIQRNFGEYVNAQREYNANGDAVTVITPKKEFDSSEFSQYELDLINGVIDKYKGKKSSELVAITHAKGGLWDLTKKENDLDFSIANISDVSIDLGRLVKENPDKYENFKEATEHMMFLSSMSEVDV